MSPATEERLVVPNRATKRSFEFLDRVNARGVIGMAVANSGVAKSYSIKAWRKRHENVRHVWMEAYTGTKQRVLLTDLATGLGLSKPRDGTLDVLRTMICERLAADPVLVIIDEADLLRVAAFDLLRSIWDRVADMRDTDGESAFPLALYGTPKLREMLMREDLDRLRRRVKERTELPPMNKEETELAVRRKWPEVKVDAEALPRLTQMSKGSFGWLNDIVPLASHIAAKDGGVVTEAILRAVPNYLVGLE